MTGTFQLYRPPDDYQPPSEGVGEHSGADADLQYALALQQEESDLLAVQEAQLVGWTYILNHQSIILMIQFICIIQLLEAGAMLPPIPFSSE